jgi:hypothetical protein
MTSWLGVVGEVLGGRIGRAQIACAREDGYISRSWYGGVDSVELFP